MYYALDAGLRAVLDICWPGSMLGSADFVRCRSGLGLDFWGKMPPPLILLCIIVLLLYIIFICIIVNYFNINNYERSAKRGAKFFRK